jgi:hypothetical protein
LTDSLTGFLKNYKKISQRIEPFDYEGLLLRHVKIDVYTPLVSLHDFNEYYSLVLTPARL